MLEFPQTLNGEFYVTVKWEVPDHPGLLDAIHRFELKRYLKTSSDRMMVDENVKVPLNVRINLLLAPNFVVCSIKIYSSA